VNEIKEWGIYRAIPWGFLRAFNNYGRRRNAGSLIKFIKLRK